MTLPPFELHRPASIDEAAALMAEYGDTAAYYCGGTELLLAMKLGYAQYDHLVSVRAIPELKGVQVHNGALVIGAATTHRQIERSPTVLKYWPAFVDMARQVANIRVRSTGTLGGNLCFADPHSDPGTFLLVAEAELVCRLGEETRVVPLDSFLLGPYETVLRAGELLTEIRVPPMVCGAAIVHKKVSFHERPAATVSCLLRVDSGMIWDVRIAVGSVGVVPVRAREAEHLLGGVTIDKLDTAKLESAAAAAGVAAKVVEDSNGSREYKEHLVRVLVARSIREALNRFAPVTG